MYIHQGIASAPSVRLSIRWFPKITMQISSKQEQILLMERLLVQEIWAPVYAENLGLFG